MKWEYFEFQTVLFLIKLKRFAGNSVYGGKLNMVPYLALFPIGLI